MGRARSAWCGALPFRLRRMRGARSKMVETRESCGKTIVISPPGLHANSLPDVEPLHEGNAGTDALSCGSSCRGARAESEIPAMSEWHGLQGG